MSNQAYCWCDNCGFVREIPSVAEEEKLGSLECPDCNEAGDFCFLQCGTEIPDHIIPEEPLQKWTPS